MHPKSIYIASTEPRGGSLTIAIGLMEMLKGKYKRVAFFRPIIPDDPQEESDIDFMLRHFKLDMDYEDCYGFKISEYTQAYGEDSEDKLYQTLISKVEKLSKLYDFILIEGSPRYQSSMIFDFDINLRIAKNLGTLYIPVLNAKDRSFEEIINETHIIAEAIDDEGCIHLATFINRCDEKLLGELQSHLQTKENEQIYLLPEVPELDTPTLCQIAQALGAEMVLGDKEQLQRLVYHKKIAAMGVENYLARIEDGDLVIVPGDRIDIITASLVSFYAKNHPNIAGIILSGGMRPSEEILNLLNDFSEVVVPILAIPYDSFQAVIALNKVQAKITPEGERKITLSKGLFDTHVNKNNLAQRFLVTTNDIMTPAMFQYKIFEQAKSRRQRIILPESSDERILRAAEILIRRDIVDIILLGDAHTIDYQSKQLGLDISKAKIVNPKDPELIERFANTLYHMRKERGLTHNGAMDSMDLVNYFATMMMHEGMADGMVSGAIHTTADTVRPALQIIKTTPDTAIVSSLFFMCLDTKVLVYADCAINLDPIAEHLAHIAISSADSAARFGIEPRVAMLSYSTGDSGVGPDVKKVREATKIVQNLRPDIPIEGPIQYDAAIDMKVAQQKLPHSKIAGKATVFIFPDLNTGNNTYKAVQRSTGALAIGPILQGLRMPINDLSRGCLVDDIVNTVAITAIQAQRNHQESNQ